MISRNSDEPAVSRVSSQTGEDPEAPDLFSVKVPPASQVQNPNLTSSLSKPFFALASNER
jgi:hypothetical protein